MAKDLSVDKTFILGPLLILQKLFEKSGINTALERLPEKPKTTIDIQKIRFALTAGRFIDPGSKLRVFERQQKPSIRSVAAGMRDLCEVRAGAGPCDMGSDRRGKWVGGV